MIQQSYEDAVLKTVMFWSDKSFRTILNQNNGDDSPQGGIMFALMNMVSGKAQESITEEKIKLFEKKLTELLMSCDKYDRTLDVDYHPCILLSEAAKFAEIDEKCFPCKTVTRIDEDNTVHAKYQYGAKWILL